MNTTPTSYNLIGYDCLRYMLRPFDKDNIVLSRADFMAKIKSGGPFEGLYRNVKLDNRNRNVLLQLLRFDYGQIIPLN